MAMQRATFQTALTDENMTTWMTERKHGKKNSFYVQSRASRADPTSLLCAGGLCGWSRTVRWRRWARRFN